MFAEKKFAEDGNDSLTLPNMESGGSKTGYGISLCPGSSDLPCGERETPAESVPADRPFPTLLPFSLWQ
jgi:hypothetical protein